MGGLDDVAIRWFELCDTGKTGQLYLTFALQAQVREGVSARARALACGGKPCRLQLLRCALKQAWPCHACNATGDAHGVRARRRCPGDVRAEAAAVGRCVSNRQHR